MTSEGQSIQGGISREMVLDRDCWETILGHLRNGCLQLSLGDTLISSLHKQKVLALPDGRQFVFSEHAPSWAVSSEAANLGDIYYVFTGLIDEQPLQLVLFAAAGSTTKEYPYTLLPWQHAESDKEASES